MKKRLHIVALSLAAAMVLTVSACGRDAGSSDASSGTAGQKKVTLALSTLNNPFFVDVRDGALAEAEAKGLSLTVLDAQNDATTQSNQIQTDVSAGTAGIIINPVDSDAAAAAIKPALDKKIPVVAVDRAVTGATVTSFIASDNVAGGKQAADALAKAIGEKGKIIQLQGTAGTSASRDRGQGFTDGMKAYPNIQIVATQTAGFDRTQGLDVTTNLLQANPDVVGIFAENDEMALGAIQALGDKAGKTVFVVGFDGSADGLKAITAGTLTATIAQQPKELGKTAVDAMADALAGNTPAATQPVPVQTVTKDNVADFS
ncbi:substrate-binding domain-containing protein [Propionicicella superfundia]|uniref:substrate-binding domain-containing protein n=1 Tax=Propionicicella superfundia TaxID=348582 RepID=UPI0004273759|nr:substrate-binding domain-containing protein [Propionicicella superfundia]